MSWLESLINLPPERKQFAFTIIILMAIVIGSLFYCFGRMDFDRSHPETPLSTRISSLCSPHPSSQ